MFRMRSSLLQEKASPARTGVYRGADAAAAFSPPTAEFEILRTGAGVFEPTWRARIVVSGEDRVRWLNGMVTNNIRDLVPGRGLYSFVLNPQGRIQGDVTAYNRGDYLLLATDEFQAAPLAAWFDRYIIMDDVELANISDKVASLAVKGPKAAECLRSAGFAADLEPLQIVDTTWNNIGISVTRGASERFPEFEIWFAPEHSPALWDAWCMPEHSPSATNLSSVSASQKVFPRTGKTSANANCPRRPNRSTRSISPRAATSARRSSNVSVRAATFTADSPGLLSPRPSPPGPSY